MRKHVRGEIRGRTGFAEFQSELNRVCPRISLRRMTIHRFACVNLDRAKCVRSYAGGLPFSFCADTWKYPKCIFGRRQRRLLYSETPRGSAARGFRICMRSICHGDSRFLKVEQVLGAYFLVSRLTFVHPFVRIIADQSRETFERNIDSLARRLRLRILSNDPALWKSFTSGSRSPRESIGTLKNRTANCIATLRAR